MLPDSLIDLAGLILSAEDLLAALLDTAPNPTFVVDSDDVVRFVNPAAVTALGYDRADELLGRPSHDAIHYKRPDGTPYPPAECPLRLARTRGQAVTSDLDQFFRRDGSSFAVSFATVPIEVSDGRGAVIAFVDIEDQLRAEQMLREQAAQSNAREESLLRIAGLVAGGAGSADVFAAIAREVGHVVGVPVVGMWRYEPDGVTATVIGAWSNAAHPYQTGTRWPARRRDRPGEGSEHGSHREDRRLHRDPRHGRRRRPRERVPSLRRRPDSRRRGGLGRDDGRRP